MPKKPFEINLDPKTTTVAKAQEQMQQRVRGSGVICPCCKQLVRVIEKELSPTMAYVLILMYRHFLDTPEDWLHVSKYLENMAAVGSEVRGGEWSKLKNWKLIEEHPPVKKSVLSNKPVVDMTGRYRITESGKKFVRCESKVPDKILLYDGHLMGFGTKDVTIKDCLGKSYRYEDLMAGNLGGFVV